MKLRIERRRVELRGRVARHARPPRPCSRPLPFESRAQTWGEEVYFTTPVSAKLEPDAKQIVEPGTVCFWTEGDALALPYGRTPISTDERPKLASRCNVLGTHRRRSRRRCRRSSAGEKITVSKA